MDLARTRGLDLSMSFDWHDYHLILDQVRQRRGACVIPRHRVPAFCTDGIVAHPLRRRAMHLAPQRPHPAQPPGFRRGAHRP